MSDLIDRKAALDAISCDITVTGRQNAELVAATIGAFADRIKALPSVQPEYSLDEHCTDCKEYDQERHCCPRWNRVIRQTLKDAQPERKKGKWVHEIDTGADMLKCSACECRVIEREYKTAVGLHVFTYCPYCGAKMEVADGK